MYSYGFCIYIYIYIYIHIYIYIYIYIYLIYIYYAGALFSVLVLFSLCWCCSLCAGALLSVVVLFPLCWCSSLCVDALLFVLNLNCCESDAERAEMDQDAGAKATFEHERKTCVDFNAEEVKVFAY